MRTLLAVFALALAGACANQIEDGAARPADELVLPPPPPSVYGFEVRRDQPVLLPFWVRHQRLAAVLDVPLTDPAFDALIANRLLLGDDDHASGVAPDLQWSPARMALWARVLKPVCAHPNLKARHPFLSLDLTRAAWGRDATVDEVNGIKEDLDATGLTGAAREQAACIAILSSLEHVSQ